MKLNWSYPWLIRVLIVFAQLSLCGHLNVSLQYLIGEIETVMWDVILIIHCPWWSSQMIRNLALVAFLSWLISCSVSHICGGCKLWWVRYTVEQWKGLCVCKTKTMLICSPIRLGNLFVVALSDIVGRRKQVYVWETLGNAMLMSS